MAVYEHDAQTFVVCEEGRLQYVVAATKVQSELRELIANVDGSQSIFFAANLKDRPLVADAVATQAAEFGAGNLIGTLAESGQSFVLSGSLEGDDIFRLAVSSSDENNAQVIQQAVEASAQRATTFLESMQGALSGKALPLWETGNALVRNVAVERNGKKVDVSIANPGNLAEFFQAVGSLLSDEVASRPTTVK